MIKLHQFPIAWDIPNTSPFCWKIEAYLRMSKIPFEVVAFPDPRKAPKGKLPFIDDDGTVVADSSAVIAHLQKKHKALDDAKLSEVERAIAHTLRRMTEEHLYWVMLYSRWIDEPGWSHTRAYLHAGLPPLVRSFVPGIIQGSLRKQLEAQGIGRHAREDIYALGKADLSALSSALGDKKFFMGDEVSTIDATMTAFLGSIFLPPFETQVKKDASSFDNLRRYSSRMHEKYFTSAK